MCSRSKSVLSSEFIYTNSLIINIKYNFRVGNIFNLIASTISVLLGIFLKQRKFSQPIRSNDTKIPSLFPVVWDTWSVYHCTITGYLFSTLLEDDTLWIWLNACLLSLSPSFCCHSNFSIVLFKFNIRGYEKINFWSWLNELSDILYIFWRFTLK